MENTRRPSLFGPILLIGLGVLLLLQNLGYLPAGFWATAWRLWPAVLVIIGLDMVLGRRSGVLGVIGSVLLLVLVAVGLFWAAQVAARQQGLRAQPVPVRLELNEAQRAEIALDFGAGRLLVGRAEDDRYLVDGLAAAVHESHTVEDGVARVELRHTARDVIVIPFTVDLTEAVWDLGLTDAVPLDLTLRAGVGQAVVDLTGLQVERLDMNMGVGQARVALPARGRLQGSVSGGIGELVLILPADLPARLTVGTGIGGLSVPPSFTRRDNVYETPGFSTAGDYLDLNVSLGIGQVTIR